MDYFEYPTIASDAVFQLEKLLFHIRNIAK